MVARMYKCVDETAKASCRTSKIDLFGNLEQFINEYSGFSDLVFENFQSIFIYYGLFGALLFVAFCVHLFYSAKLVSALIKALGRWHLA